MPATSTTVFNNRTLTFTEEDHSYIDDRNLEYDSVTTLLKNYSEPFDAQATAARMEREGKGVASELLAQWDATREEASTYGTLVHECIEQILCGIPITVTPRNEKDRSAMSRAWDFFRGDDAPTFEVLKCEAMLFHPDWLVSGTADLIARYPDGTILIGDHKTNADIHKPAYQGKTLSGPLSHLPDNSISKYTMQLNIYQALLVSAGYFPRDTKFRRELYWIPHTESPVEVIPLPEMQREAYEVILDWVHARVPF